MKRYWSLYIILLLFIIPLFAQPDTLTTADYDSAVSMLRGNIESKVYHNNVRPRWLDDGRFWYRVNTREGNQYVLYDPATKEKITYPSEEELLAGISIPQEPDLKYTEILSPDGKKVAFIRDWNLWIRYLDSEKEVQLTNDGEENFGYATDNAGWRHSDRPILLWSPDSRKIATFQQDQRHINDMYLVKTMVGAPELEKWKYPLPEDEEIIKIHRVIIEVDQPRVIRLKMEADPRRGTLCDDISCTGKFDDNEWSPDGKTLAFVSSSRDHKEAILRIADAATGEVKDIYKETVETQYESGQGGINWKYLPETSEFIWYSERDNWGHLYLYDLYSGQLKNQITKGDFVVTRIRHLDKTARIIYFEGQGKESNRDPYFSHFYSIKLDGSELKLLTPENGHHQINLSPDNQFFIDNFSQPDIPTISAVRKINGFLIEVIERADITDIKAIGWQPPLPFTVKSADGQYDLYGLMFIPTTLESNKKYPVINYIYPGPQGGSVGNRSFSASRRGHQALAELGFVVITLDGTCNPGRSKSFHDACYGDMSVNTLPDQISGIQQLADKYPYLDLEKVGVFGHSGGGFAAASAMFKYPDFYKVGVAQSGNHDNRNYEDDWGERYVGLLDEDNYKVQANQVYAGNLQGKLLLAHGGMDDNVPPYNTYLVIEALIKANKDFDLIIYPNARHGYGRDNNYMTRRRWDYFVQHLLGAVPPKNYKIE